MSWWFGCTVAVAMNISLVAVELLLVPTCEGAAAAEQQPPVFEQKRAL
jgi:hypothetical protein